MNSPLEILIIILAGLTFSVLFAAAAVVIVFAAIIIPCKCVIFHRMGRPWWAALVPLYSDYVEFGATWSAKYALYYIALHVAGLMADRVQVAPVADLLTFAGRVATILFIMQAMTLARSFGRSTCFGLGLAAFPFIFYPVLALGHDAYVGPVESPWQSSRRRGYERPRPERTRAERHAKPRRSVKRHDDDYYGLS